MQFKSGSKPLGIYPFVSKLIFAKSPLTIEKSEQFRCHLNHSLLLAPDVRQRLTSFACLNYFYLTPLAVTAMLRRLLKTTNY